MNQPGVSHRLHGLAHLLGNREQHAGMKLALLVGKGHQRLLHGTACCQLLHEVLLPLGVTSYAVEREDVGVPADDLHDLQLFLQQNSSVQHRGHCNFPALPPALLHTLEAPPPKVTQAKLELREGEVVACG